MGHQVKLVMMRSFSHDYRPIFLSSLERLRISAEVVEIPYLFMHELTPERVEDIRSMLVPSRHGQKVFYSPGVLELFLSGDHHSFHFSGYRDWHDPARHTVLAHPWTVHQKIDRTRLVWDGKPSLSAGFRGSMYRDAAMVRLGRRLPKALRHWLLKGDYLRHSSLFSRALAAGLPVRFMLAFPRAESLDSLAVQVANEPDFACEIVDTGGFTGQDDAKASYVSSMLAVTYAICPRGSENFSFRVYEALQFGRVPVVIDTHMVLPDGLPWDDIAVIVPYDQLHRIAHIIRHDYEAHDAAAFARRQELALATMDALAEGRWLDAELARVLALSPAPSPRLFRRKAFRRWQRQAPQQTEMPGEGGATWAGRSESGPRSY